MYSLYHPLYIQAAILVEEIGQMLISGLLVVLIQAVAVLRFSLAINGVPSVIHSGDLLMLKLSVVTWATVVLCKQLLEDVSIAVYLE